MHYTNFKGKSLSKLGFGAMRFPQFGEGWGMPINYEEALPLIEHAIANGVNYFDTAYVYHGGDSEKFLATALAKYPRDSYYLADKFNLAAQSDYRIQFAEQLERLQTDYIDFYMCHGISDTNIDGYLKQGAIEYFQEEKAKGSIRNIGFSFHGSPDILRQTVAHYEWDFAMIQLNYFDWFHVNGRENYNTLKENNISIMVMEPVHGGLLASLTPEGNALLKEAEPNRSIASWALRFILSLSDVKVILSGMSSMEQVVDNLAIVKECKPLSDTEMKLLEKASTMFFQTIGATCTDCRYCTDCPKDLNIPFLLHCYNDYKASGEWRLNRLKALPKEKQPGACTACGICVGQCPQNLDIPKLMAEMAEKEILK